MDYLSLCLTCKDENDYLAEWLDYHILMGVDRFYIYDNQSKISLRQTLAEYIAGGWVVVVDLDGVGVQLHAYDHCLRSFGHLTMWLGFIDTDEFLVPKSSQNLKEFLKEYEGYGGLAVSSFFFGSNGHVHRPVEGQIASYFSRTHPCNFLGNTLIKSIVRPERVLLPNSPHDFSYVENFFCVNERFLRVDGQQFPNYTEKIQLNHYFCRSQEEIERKLRRGNSGNIAWSRERFDAVNQQSTYPDTAIMKALDEVFRQQVSNIAVGDSQFYPMGLVEKMAVLAKTFQAEPLQVEIPNQAVLRPEIDRLIQLIDHIKEAEGHEDIDQCVRVIHEQLLVTPVRVNLYAGLVIGYINLNQPEKAWEALGQAWRLAPNSYLVLSAMAYYFLRIRNFGMAEKTCHLLLGIAPQDLKALAFLCESLIEQQRWVEALKIGEPVLELAANLGELPEAQAVFLAGRLAAHLENMGDFGGAVRLWEIALRCQPDSLRVLVGLSQALLGSGERARGLESLEKARQAAPQNNEILALLRQAGNGLPQAKKHRH